MEDKNRKETDLENKPKINTKPHPKPFPPEKPDVDDLIFADEIIKQHSEK